MVSHRVGLSYSLKDIRPPVVYPRNEAMLDGSEALELCSELDSKTLQSEADTKDGKDMLVVQIPEVLHYTDICWIVRRAWSRAHHDGGEVLEVRTELVDGKTIVLDNANLAVRNGSTTQSS